MRWEWILFATIISLSLVHQLSGSSMVSTKRIRMCVCVCLYIIQFVSNERRERAVRDRSPSRHHQHIHFISLHHSSSNSIRSPLCNLSSLLSPSSPSISFHTIQHSFGIWVALCVRISIHTNILFIYLNSNHFAHSSRKTYQRRVKRANHVTNLVFTIFST